VAAACLADPAAAQFRRQYQNQYQGQTQGAYYAGIAYSQSTGKIGYTARQARTEDAAKMLAVQSCGAPDAKTYIWGPNQWVAIATVDGVIGTAGFGRGDTDAEAQQKALAECGKRAAGRAYRVAFCIHALGQRSQLLSSVAGTAPAPKPAFIAAIAFSPSTGKIGHTAGQAKTKADAEKLALANAGEKDARVFTWGEQWVAIAVADEVKGTAGFSPGATREEAERAALAQCQKLAPGKKCHVALVVNAAGQQKQEVAKPVVSAPAANRAVAPTPAPATAPAAPLAPVVTPVAPVPAAANSN
jgi:hypothetical protein